MIIDAANLLEILRSRKKTDKERKSVYLSNSTFTEFTSCCEDQSTSEMLELLMELFIESKKNKTPVEVKD